MTCVCWRCRWCPRSGVPCCLGSGRGSGCAVRPCGGLAALSRCLPALVAGCLGTCFRSSRAVVLSVVWDCGLYWRLSWLRVFLLPWCLPSVASGCSSLPALPFVMVGRSGLGGLSAWIGRVGVPWSAGVLVIRIAAAAGFLCRCRWSCPVACPAWVPFAGVLGGRLLVGLAIVGGCWRVSYICTRFFPVANLHPLFFCDKKRNEKSKGKRQKKNNS